MLVQFCIVFHDLLGVVLEEVVCRLPHDAALDECGPASVLESWAWTNFRSRYGAPQRDSAPLLTQLESNCAPGPARLEDGDGDFQGLDAIGGRDQRLGIAGEVAAHMFELLREHVLLAVGANALRSPFRADDE